MIPHIQNISMAVLVLLFILEVYPSTSEVKDLLHGRSIQDIALYRTNLFKHDRKNIEAFCNQKNLSCFSDDAGLNVMLDNPQIIFPLVQSMLIQSGFLEMTSTTERLQKSVKALENIIERMKITAEIHRIIGGNGNIKRVTGSNE